MYRFLLFHIFLAGAQAHSRSYYTDGQTDTIAEGARLNVVSKQEESSVCLDGLMALLQQGFGVDLLNLDVLNKVMNDDSVLSVAQVGDYQGLADIKEYATYLSSFVFESFDPMPGFPKISMNNDTDPDNCDIDIVLKYTFKFNTSFYEDGYAEVLGANSFLFNASETGITIKHAKVFLPPDFPGSMGYLALPDKLPEHVCGIMEDSCEDVWKANNLDQASCKEKLEALDASEGDSHWIDGNTQVCRVLHASFAMTNPLHCPHISFEPMEDDKGRLKCQTSKKTTAEDLFSDKTIAFFQTSADGLGFDETFYSYYPASTSPSSTPVSSDDCADKTIFQELMKRFI